jgi:predicted nuclease of predicted toxin-antitoxin system
MIRLYMDENVIGSITRGLRQRGVDVLTVLQDGRTGITDTEVLDRATELDRVLFTYDDDFLREAAVRASMQQHFVGISYAHQNRISIGQCVDQLELIAHAGNPEDFVNRVEYLPLW